MKLFSISTIKSPASALVFASTIMLAASGVAQAQSSGNTSGGTTAGQGSAAGQQPASGETDAAVDPWGILDEGIDHGVVDQEKRVERNVDPRSPSPDDHVDIRYEKEIKDPDKEQGGPIGPN